MDEPTKRGLVHAAKAAPPIIDSKWAAAGETANGWKYTFAGGRAGYDPGLKAALTNYEVGAQLSNEVLYPNTSVDDMGEALQARASITITIQKDRPADASNWLPAPDGQFNLTMRFYGPGPSVLDGSDRLPAVKRI
jgi:hypothetical protein